jgi:hypothetical protein
MEVSLPEGETVSAIEASEQLRFPVEDPDD